MAVISGMEMQIVFAQPTHVCNFHNQTDALVFAENISYDIVAKKI